MLYYNRWQKHRNLVEPSGKKKKNVSVQNTQTNPNRAELNNSIRKHKEHKEKAGRKPNGNMEGLRQEEGQVDEDQVKPNGAGQTLTAEGNKERKSEGAQDTRGKRHQTKQEMQTTSQEVTYCRDYKLKIPF